MGHFNVTLMWITSLVAVILSQATLASAHPSDGFQTREPNSQYGTASYGFPPELSLGDLTFSSPYPAPNLLSEREKYYLFGTVNGPEGFPLAPYYQDVMRVVYRYYNIDGSIPPWITPAVIAKSLGLEESQVDRIYLETLRSPITNTYPSLEATTFTPGQLFVRTLTDAEIRHFSQYLPLLNTLYFNHEWWDPIDNCWKPGRMLGPVMYVRVYGETDVIYEQLYYAYH